MNQSETDLQIVFLKRDEALREQQRELESVDIPALIEECRRLRELKEAFANSVEDLSVTYTRS